MSRSTPLDVVLFGATGFTGKLVAEYLSANAQGVRWAIAGRNREKLEAIKRDLGAADLPILIGDSSDAASLREIVRQTQVVCTTVGPYSLYGTPLVEQCVEEGAGYCDLTGEPHWVREMIDRFHARAEQTGARIVHASGFDSIPSDLGVLMVAEHMERVHGKKLGRVRQRVTKLNGGASGGTFASMFEILKAAKAPEVRRIIGDPYAFSPKDFPRGKDRNEPFKPEKDGDRGRWTGPFIMASFNTRVVRRSNALFGGKYGPSFAYEEKMDAGAGFGGWMKATAISVGLGAFAGAASTPVLRPIVQSLLPKPGEGPSKEQRERGSFRYNFFADSDDGAAKVEATVSGKGDPGYAATARMLGEAAMCLAKDSLPARGGILTPATAMGFSLIERLRRAGMVFSCE